MGCVRSARDVGSEIEKTTAEHRYRGGEEVLVVSTRQARHAAGREGPFVGCCFSRETGSERPRPRVAAPPSTSPASPPTPEEIDAFLADNSAGRLREGRRSAARVARLWRALGPALARRRPLRRHRRRQLRFPHPADAPLPRLGHRRVQPRPALRPVPARATRRRPAARAQRRSTHRHRLPRQRAPLRFARRRLPAAPHHRGHHRQPRPHVLGLTSTARAATTTSSIPSPRRTTTPSTASSTARAIPGRASSSTKPSTDSVAARRAAASRTGLNERQPKLDELDAHDQMKKAKADVRRKMPRPTPKRKERTPREETAPPEGQYVPQEQREETSRRNAIGQVGDGRRVPAQIKGDPNTGRGGAATFPAVLGGQTLPEGRREAAGWNWRLDLDRPEEPADRPRHGQSHLAAPFRPTGLVSTPNDFGRKGQGPIAPGAARLPGADSSTAAGRSRRCTA